MKKTKKNEKQARGIKQKYKALDELLSIFIKEIIEEYNLNNQKPTVLHLTNKIISTIDIPKTGILGLNFAKIEKTLWQLTKKSIQRLVIDLDLIDSIAYDFEYHMNQNNEKMILLKNGLDTYDKLIEQSCKEYKIDFIKYDEISDIDFAFIKNKLKKSKIYSCYDLSIEGLKEEKKIKNLCKKYKIYFEKLFIDKEHIINQNGIKLTLSEKISGKDFIRSYGNKKYLIDIFSDRNFIKRKIEEVAFR